MRADGMVDMKNTPGGQIDFFRAQISRILRVGLLIKLQRCTILSAVTSAGSGAGEDNYLMRWQ